MFSYHISNESQNIRVIFLSILASILVDLSFSRKFLSRQKLRAQRILRKEFRNALAALACADSYQLFQ